MKMSMGLMSVVGSLAVSCGGSPADELGEAAVESAEASSGARAGSAVARKLDGFLFAVPCIDEGSFMDCRTSETSSSEYRRSFRMKGKAGVIYELRIRVRGIAEGKRYVGGVRRAGSVTTNPEEGGDYLYTGGIIMPSTYNSYSLIVSPAVPGAATVYRLNSIPSSEEHSTYVLDYELTIPVYGDGVVSFEYLDANSRQIKNCGAGVDPTPCEPRSISLSSASPAAPSWFSQPYGAPNPGQWVHFDVLSAEPAG